MKLPQALFFIVILIAGLCMQACRKDRVIHPLEFSVDTVWFDTMFTQLPTSLRSFKVHNVSDVDVKIDRIALEQDAEYRMNINGLAGNAQNDILISAHDSIFVFLEATFAVNEHDSIGSHENAIVFDYHEYSDRLVVAAWAQDVTKNKGKHVQTETWTDQRPYIIYDSLVVEEGHTLTLEAGVKLYFHLDAKMLVYGQLVVNGTLDKPVVFAADRPERSYRNLGGQWDNVIFKTSGLEHSCNWLVVKNAAGGFLFNDDSLTTSLTLKNCRFENSRGGTLLDLQNVDLLAENCLFAVSNPNAGSLLSFNKGGSLDFTHCTFSAYSGSGLIRLQNYSGDTVYEASVVMKNCLIGSSSERLLIDKKDDREFPVVFHSCMAILDSHLSEYKPYFEDAVSFDFESDVMQAPNNYVYTLTEKSTARDKASLEYAESLPTDLAGNDRLADGKPDVGAFEFVPEEDEEED